MALKQILKLKDCFPRKIISASTRRSGLYKPPKGYMASLKHKNPLFSSSTSSRSGFTLIEPCLPAGRSWFSRDSFTLIELLVVVSIISILAVFVIMTLNPSELLKQGRDSQRISDLSTINSALSLYQVDNPSGSMGTASTTYVSVPDPTATSTTLGNQCTGLSLPSLPSGYAYHCSASSTYRNTNGHGWIPVNFNSITYGTPMGSLPVDPINTTSSGDYYTYSSGGSWELTATPESYKIRSDSSKTDSLTGAIVKGSNLSLSALYNPNGLAGYWKFDEGSGTTAADSSGNGNGGTATNTTWVNGEKG
jgi:prepilin-type N-terminal cleavage/methylation domain-containing protein